jgi:hypothetical protein
VYWIRVKYSSPIHLRLFDLDIELQASSQRISSLVMANYSALCGAPSANADLIYLLEENGQGLTVRRMNSRDSPVWSGLGPAEFLFVLEKDLTIECQKLRPDLYFLHAAALRYRDTAFLLVARSGGGKSTTCWGLVNHGCDYLSDELAPIYLQNFQVYPFPHALCLKAEPPSPYRTPPETLCTAPVLRIPAESFPVSVVDSPVELSAIFHIQYVSSATIPSARPISAAESAGLLYANALNPLSHAGDGLDAAVDIARHSSSFRVSSGSLELVVAEILSVLDKSGA